MDKTKQQVIFNAFKAIIFSGIPFWYVAVESFIFKTNLFMGYPHNSDEFCYWRVLYSFSKNGFDFASTCGNYGSDAPIGPLGEHGLSTLFAWPGALLLGNVNAHTIFLWNLLILSISLLVLYIAAKPNVLECVLIVGVIMCNSVVQEQWYSHMMELPCIAVIIICFSFEIAYRRDGKNLWLVLGLIAALWATCMRICYIILVFPFIVSLWNIKKFGKIKKMLSIGIMLITFYVIKYTSSLFMKTSVSFLSDLNDNATVFDKVAMLPVIAITEFCSIKETKLFL